MYKDGHGVYWGDCPHCGNFVPESTIVGGFCNKCKPVKNVPQIDWFQVGKKFTEGKEYQYLTEFESGKWYPTDKSFAVWNSYALKEIIKEFKLKVEKIKIIGTDDYFIYGLRCKFKQGKAELFFLDSGNDIITPLASLKYWE